MPGCRPGNSQSPASGGGGIWGGAMAAMGSSRPPTPPPPNLEARARDLLPLFASPPWLARLQLRLCDAAPLACMQVCYAVKAVPVAPGHACPHACMRTRI
jgi:hypothetical protein